WPSPNLTEHAYWPRSDGVLGEAAGEPASLAHAGTLAHGLNSPVWCPYGAPGDLAPDQRGDDGRALTFTTAPLAEPMEVLGFPELTVELSVDRPVALLAARLCD